MCEADQIGAGNTEIALGAWSLPCGRWRTSTQGIEALLIQKKVEASEQAVEEVVALASQA
jgi:hypothetical protein